MVFLEISRHRRSTTGTPYHNTFWLQCTRPHSSTITSCLRECTGRARKRAAQVSWHTVPQSCHHLEAGNELCPRDSLLRFALTSQVVLLNCPRPRKKPATPGLHRTNLWTSPCPSSSLTRAVGTKLLMAAQAEERGGSSGPSSWEDQVRLHTSPCIRIRSSVWPELLCFQVPCTMGFQCSARLVWGFQGMKASHQFHSTRRPTPRGFSLL